MQGLNGLSVNSLPVSVVQIEDVQIEEDDDDHPNCFIRGVQETQTKLAKLCTTHSALIRRIITFLLLVAFVGYFTYAMIHSRLEDEGSIRLLWVTCVVVLVYLIHLVVSIDAIRDVIADAQRKVAPHEEKISWSVRRFL